ncbi:redox-regulated ATPase YchF [Candidatus Gracilibacteria bacterium 28_42_T64]|nr:redox-regulated ATPase YchF [Candidatus Gracilibacteria bacterium 28_42_T64]
MKIGIVGLPNVGKSTLFNALTKNYSADAQNFPFCTIEPNTGIVNVADKRLEKIRAAVDGQKVIPATCEFIDIAGIVKGASAGEGLGNKFLANIREADAILQVVRVFENSDIIHVHGTVDPKEDIEVINSELILADMDSVEKRIAKDSKKAKSDKDIARAMEVYSKVLEGLNAGSIVTDMGLTEEESDDIYDLHLLTNKKFVYACNVSEDMMDTSEEDLKKLLGLTSTDTIVVPICATLESDMIEMSDDERDEFLNEMGLITTGLDNLIKASYDALGLEYYFTAGEMEVRAWTVHKGSTAPQAAGVIHTDFEKGFIKADVVKWNDLVEAGGWSQARVAGKVGLEGKEYIVQDGDVILFKFNN